MSTTSKSQEQAMYVASDLDRDWLLSKQRVLYARSQERPDYVFHKLWGLVTEPANLRSALDRVARNRGARTSGVDRVTVRMVLEAGVDAFVRDLRSELRAGTFRPSPVRRVLIPKIGYPGKFRPLGIPTVKDRVVQAALKSILEPIFEADFYPTSFGFRPGRGVHGAVEYVKQLLRPRTSTKAERRPAYQWAIEGDIKGCFDNIGHHGLMKRVRLRVGDAKVSRLVLAFLKAGILSGGQFTRSENGTPQGGILSPLLANIALSVLDERYEQVVRPSRTASARTDPVEMQRKAQTTRAGVRRRREVLFFPVRYADDFLILVGAPPGADQMERAREAARQEKVEIADLLRKWLGLELSEEKTLITSVMRPMSFLGHHIRVQHEPTRGGIVSKAAIPKEKTQKLRRQIKALFRRATLGTTLESRLRSLNPIVRGWGYFYRHAWKARNVFTSLDCYVWWTIWRWLRKKHRRIQHDALVARYGWHRPGRRALKWRDGTTVPFELVSIRTQAFRFAWMHPPVFALTPMESPVHNERCTPGSEGGARKPS